MFAGRFALRVHANQIIVIVWVGLAIAYLFAAITAPIGWSQGPRAGIGVEFSDGAAILTKVDPAGPVWEAGARDGDRLVTINGLTVTEELWSSTGEVVDELEFIDRSGNLSLAAVAEETSMMRTAVFSIEFTAAAFALIGALVFSRVYRSPHVIAFSFFTLVTAIALAATPGTIVGHQSSEITFSVALLWIPVLFNGFFFQLGRPTSASLRASVPAWISVMAAVAAGLSVVTVIRYTESPGLAEFDATATWIFVALGLGLGLGVLGYRYFRTGSQNLREQTRVIAVGTVISILPVLVLSVIPSAVGIDSLVPAEFPLIASIIIPFSFGYAILRYELLGIRRLVHRGVAYALIPALVISLYAAALGAVRAWADTGRDDDYAINLVILVALLGIPMIPRVRETSVGVVDRLLYKDFTGHREVVRDVSQTAVETVMVDDLLRQVLRDIQEPLGLGFAAYVEGSRRYCRVRIKTGDVDDEFLISLHRESLLKPNSPTSDLLTDSRAEGQLIVTRLTDLVAQPAILVIGPKTTGEPFSDEDFQMIETIGGILSTAVGRLMLLEELQAKNQELMGLTTRLVDVEEQERARISGYLHDEPLQKVSYVLSQYRERQLSEDLSDVLDDAVSDLRAITATLSPAILMDLGLARSVEWLVAEADGRSGFETDLRITGEEHEPQMPGPTQLVAYRLVQESLTNCQKHAGASMVWVSLEYEHNGLLISVEDNGIGAPEGPDGFKNKADSLGLLSMRQRVESQRGFLALENRESRGFSVRARLPFDGGPAGPSAVATN